ncbi:uncharacterized protein SPSC_06073 [Sporisorium scitamineum]|uniref:N-acetyltransferase domain-containing protein n=1 Tax=Sporisorium scitamineum TaxID=49012 RepID=A0A127ZIY1_9BASI|nr:uncharacterized protein SPSC_06073 [Sporisorium scitamineum]
MTQPTPQFVTRLTRPSEVPSIARIRHDAFFTNPHNTTPDELSHLLSLEIDPNLQRPLTRLESIAKLKTLTSQLYPKPNLFLVGTYLLPPNTDITNDGLGEDKDSSDLPEGSSLVGLGIWQKVDERTPPDSEESDKKAEEEPTLLNRFFARMNRTREGVMQGRVYWFLKLLVVDPGFQRKGLGTMLVRWGTRKADKEGVDAWLESSPMGKGAYLKAGFRVLGVDRVEDERAEKGYVEWPYMIHEHQPTGKKVERERSV